MTADKCDKTRIALIGECLIEVKGVPFAVINQSYGGDSLNTALYLARIAGEAVAVSYITAMGTDTLSNAMVQCWKNEGIDTEYVLRDPARSPGVYLIQLDNRGERRFMYWRCESAARYLVQHPDFGRITDKLRYFDGIYVTGISLAILPEHDRIALIDLLTRLATVGVTIIFDTNFRSALWHQTQSARTALTALFPSIEMLLTTFDDEQQLWADSSPHDTIARLHSAGVNTVVVKLGAGGALYSDGSTLKQAIPRSVSNIVDSTGAGDSFNAAFIAGRLMGHDCETSCRLGNALARTVIQHRGAIIPKSATPSLSELLTSCELAP